ncbi:MAG: helix-turn-helix domain-containing protein [Acidovorax sp.]|jgi:hypothetical protein|nr:helix-turn-helix domain-containing protein [Acidovorax sp.]TFI40191.1 hypothetical protein E4O93_24475 [Diaphorobacter sp. DS2]
MAPSRDMTRKLSVICAISCIHRPDMRRLMDETKIPETTLKRIIKSLRDDYAMDIVFVRDSSAAPTDAQGGKRGRYGYYAINEWGLFSKDELTRLCWKDVRKERLSTQPSRP